MAQTQAAVKVVRIGGASGFWGDSVVGPVQLVDSGQIDYLAETTMALLAAARAKRPELGWATDFVDSALPAVQALADDVLPQLPALRASGVCSVSGQPLPEHLASATRIWAHARWRWRWGRTLSSSGGWWTAR